MTDPTPADSVESLVANVVDEYRARRARGEDPDPKEYAARHPAAAGILRRVLAAVRITTPPSAGDGHGSDPASEPPSAEEPLGELGDYRIVREVGRGGMGVVYDAEQVSLRRRVALKVLPFASVMDPRHLQRFKSEALAAAALDHPHIVKVYGVGCERGVHYIAFQFVDGQTLADLIRQRRGEQPASIPAAGAHDSTRTQAPDATSDEPTVPAASRRGEPTSRTPVDTAYARRVAEWGVQAAEALEHAHSFGIVHRDVKPGNLLVDARGAVFVADFGLARIASDPGVTGTGDLLGTPRYMSPEQAAARHNLVDHRSDVYALGATLYELLTLTPAVGGADRAETLRRLAEAEPIPPRKLDRGIPRDLETVFLKCLEKDPARRYPSARALADDLNRYLAGEPVWAKRPSLADRAGRWLWRRGKPIAALAAVAAVAITVALAALVWHSDRLGEAAETAKKEQEAAQKERDTAQKERDAAREERRWAQQAVDDMYTEVASRWLANRPHLQPTQRTFLEKAVEYYQRDANREDTDAGDRLRGARASYHLAQIELALDRPERAVEHFARAIRLFERLLSEQPDQPDLRRELAQVLYTSTDVPNATDRESTVRRSIAACEELVAKYSGKPDYRLTLAIGRTRLAQILADTGRTGEAERIYRGELPALKELTAGPGNREHVRTALASCYTFLGNLMHNTDRFTEAALVYREALAVLEKLKNEFPGNPDYRCRYAFNSSNLGAALRVTDPAAAEVALNTAVDQYRRLCEDYPDMADYQRELLAVLVNIAVIQKALGRPEDAVKTYREMDQRSRTFAARFRLTPFDLNVLISQQNNHANLLTNLKRYPAAEEAIRRAVKYGAQLTAAQPEVPEYRETFALAHNGLGNICYATGRFPEAEKAYLVALDINEKLLAEFPTDEYRRAVAASCRNVALVLLTGLDPEYRQAKRAVELMERAVKLNPKSALYWQWLGLARYRNDDPEGALDAFAEVPKLGKGPGPLVFVIAMAMWKIREKHPGVKPHILRYYAQGVKWSEENETEPAFRGLRGEAAVVLGLEQILPPREVVRPPTK